VNRAGGATRRRRAAAGFSLLELTISFLILIVALALAAQLLLAAQRQLIRGSARLVAPPAALWAEQLRLDASTATAVAAAGSTWRASPLELAYGDGRRVRYRNDDRRLLRQAWRQGEATPSSGRPMVASVDGFHWRVLPGGLRPLLEVEVVYRRPGLVSSTRRGGPPRLDRRTVRVALRDVGGTRW